MSKYTLYYYGIKLLGFFVDTLFAYIFAIILLIPIVNVAMYNVFFKNYLDAKEYRKLKDKMIKKLNEDDEE